MTSDPKHLPGVLHLLCQAPHETEWLEFKESNSDPERIGEYISALANSAALNGKNAAYLIWGVQNKTHKIVGTTFAPSSQKVGNENLHNWLVRLLTPPIDFSFYEFRAEGQRVVMLKIRRAHPYPVQWKGQEFIRVGSQKKKLKDVPTSAKRLWKALDATPFEMLVATENVSADDVLSELDYPKLFELLKQPLPANKREILTALSQNSLITGSEAGGWDVYNIGALLLAKRLDAFPTLARKAVRVIAYKKGSRVEGKAERVGSKGYAAGFEGLITHINGLVPENEVMGKALRKTIPMYPSLAIRELVANALIHQDLSVGGAGPTIEIFEDRMEITNPGEPLLSVDRFLDSAPRSRNEKLAALMRRLGICEERGSGIDKVVFELEYNQLPPALFEIRNGATVATLFAHQSLGKMEKSARIRACYQHACLRYVSNDHMTNSSLRQRFGIKEANKAQASRLIREAVDAEVITPRDENAGPKYMKYIPWWAAGGS